MQECRSVLHARPPLHRRRWRARPSVEQHRPKGTFQRDDLLGYSRLAHVQAFRGAGHAARLYDRHEYFKGSQFDYERVDLAALWIAHASIR